MIENKIFTRRNMFSLGAMILSSFIMACGNNLLIEEANLLPGGVMGISRLTHVVGGLFHVNIPLIVVYLGLNIPVALFCIRHISKRFVLLSLIQILMLSLFMHLFPHYRIFDQEILNVIFGGVIWGAGTTIALQGGGSTGGTDFIALYVSNKTGNEIWMQVFFFNCLQLAIFGSVAGWGQAGYSIIFQFISTRMINTFHNRYKRVVLQIFTKHKTDVTKAYLKRFDHGVTILDGTGGYTGEKTSLLLAVTSSYEASEAIEVIRRADPHAIINVVKSEKLVGNFKQPRL